jgi:hypothetical protein
LSGGAERLACGEASPAFLVAEWLHGVKGVAVIRQAISCDICGAEKKQTNHWFVAYEQAGELRVSGWSSRNRLKADSRHLCGQACLHKLADDFMARVIGEKGALRPQAAAEEMEMEPLPAAERRTVKNVQDRMHGRDGVAAQPSSAARPVAHPVAQNRPAAYDHAMAEIAVGDTAGGIEFESSARLITPAETAVQQPGPRLPQRLAAGVLPMPDRVAASAALADHISSPVPLPAEPPRYATHHWRAEAWERERERSLRTADHRSEHTTRRFSQA